MNIWFILSVLSLLFAGIYFVVGTYERSVPLTETAFYFMQTSISQAQFYLLAAILFALWSLRKEHNR